MNIFFDLDGTLLDSRKRLYTLFQDLAPESNLSIGEYWELKRNKIDHKTILTEKFGYSEDDFDHFERAWLDKIELFDYLRLDTPIHGLHDVLDALINNNNNLYIVTSRQNRENVFIQLENMGIYKYFTDVLVTEHKYKKTKLIRTLRYQDEDFLVGDTGYDVLTGKELNVNTIAVTYGFLKKEILETYKPSFVVDKLTDILPIIQNRYL